MTYFRFTIFLYFSEWFQIELLSISQSILKRYSNTQYLYLIESFLVRFGQVTMISELQYGRISTP